MSEFEHSDIKRFAADKVNLPADKATAHRQQVNALRDRLTRKIEEDPAFDLVKMLHAGSVAKGTALRTVNDLDVAVYVKAGSAPTGDAALQPWLAARLAEANPNMDPSQFTPQHHCVTVSFRGTGLDVDVVPVLYEGDENDCGYLVQKDTGIRVMTSIPMHLQFIRKRKEMYGGDFKQLIRLVKWWKRTAVNNDPEFRFKSFIIELLWAHLADSGIPLGDYPAALEHFFTYIVTTELSERVIFTDNYAKSKVPVSSGNVVEVYDPVNPENNVAVAYGAIERDRIVKAAHAALDAIGEARYSITKGEAMENWQAVLGPSFRG